MITGWNGRDFFCVYLRKHWRRRRVMYDYAMLQANTDASRKLAEKLAKDWKLDRYARKPATRSELAEAQAWLDGLS